MDQIFLDKMRFGLDELGITLSERQMGQFYEYYEYLMEGNSVMNLTAITEINDVVDKHFIDSLSLVKVVEHLTEKRVRILDVGTGAGLPGIPLKIAFPQISVVLLDSLNKRVRFLNEVIAKMKLEGIEAVHGRAEDFGREVKYREQFDFCVSRAVANLSVLSEYCIPFVKVGGEFIAYKSERAEEELMEGKKSIHLLGGEIKEVMKFSLPGTKANRTLIVVRKNCHTGRQYPRKAGMPIKEPIK